MSLLAEHLCDLAHYNEWANRVLYEAVADLRDEDFRRDLGGYVGSIHTTLNHLLSMDQLWLGRIEPPLFMPTSHDQILHDRFDMIRQERATMDQRIRAICLGLDDDRLAAPLAWTSMDGEKSSASLRQVLTHAFNHQTHHPGQVHAMFTGIGRSEPVLDYYHTMFSRD